MRLRAFVAAVVVFVALAPRLFASEKRALLIGINDYSASRVAAAATPPPDDRDWEELEGAVNDVEILHALLVSRYGFERNDVATLTDQQATRAAILGALDRQLVKPSKKGDVVFLYYSGHGSQVRNSLSNEPDKMDESIVPADSRAGAADIRDKELRRIFNAILDRGARLTVVFDSCHSGSGARGFDAGLRPRGVKPDLRDVADGANAGPRPENRGALVIAAAQDFDFAYETRDRDGNVHGAFSWALENALREAGPGEPAIDMFRRAQARLRLDMPMQEPVLAGDAEARLTPFLGLPGERHKARPAIAVEQVTPDGKYVLQGGWVNGITVGSELEANGVRLEVTALRGIARCDAEVTPQRAAARGAPATLQPGALLDVVAWAVPPGRPLRVWMPLGPEGTTAFARALAGEASRKKIRWITDPTAAAATHLIRWRDGRWEVLARDKGERPIGGGGPAQLLRAIPPGSSIFLQLPAPASLVRAIDIREQDGIEMAADAQSADYILAGRLSEGRVEYAWLRRSLAPAGRRCAALPLRSGWNEIGAAATPLALADAISRLRRIFGWQQLESPPGEGLPYRLAIRRAGDGTLVEDGVLVGQSRYGLVLRARSGRMPENVEPRYVYVFVIDSEGKSVLLYPPSGSVENRLPIGAESERPAPLPAEIPLGAQPSFRATRPYGVDTYFLLTTDEALPDPWSLEWDGVRAVKQRHASALEELLALGGSTRSATLHTPPNWSIEKLVFESIPNGRTLR